MRKEYGKIMAKYYVKANTMIKIMRMKERANIREVVISSHRQKMSHSYKLETLSQAEEYPVKFQSDKAHLNALNRQPGIRFAYH